MKSTIRSLIACLILMTLAVGCGTNSADRVALLEGAVVQANEVSAALGEKMQAIEIIVDEQRLGDIVLNEAEAIERIQVLCVVLRPGHEVVDPDDLVAFREKTFG